MKAPCSTILIVDDDPFARRVVREILAREGHELIEVGSGEEALDRIALCDIDLVLLDVMMPGIDGIEVCRRIRVDLEQHVLPIILMSALVDARSRADGKAAGAVDFLTKPIQSEELVARVDNLLLLSAYYEAHQCHRVNAESEARRWKLISRVASDVAGCLDPETVTNAIARILHNSLPIEVTAYFEVSDSRLDLISMSTTKPHELAAVTWQRADAATRVLGGWSRGDREPCPYAPLMAQLDLEDVFAIPVLHEGELCGTFCFGWTSHLVQDDLYLLDELQPHLTNAIANVRSHTRIISEFMREAREREAAETALRLSEERHRMLFDASPLPIWVFDPTTFEILAVNDAFARTLGYSRDELLRMRTVDLKARTGSPAPLANPKRSKNSLHYACKDGRVVELDFTSHVTMVDGNLVVLGLGLDVTNARRMEDQLRQAQKMEAIGRLAGGVAHDFNNILAAILTAAELAIGDLGTGHPSVAEDLRDIVSSAHRAASLTRQLLAFSRQQRREIKTLALNKVVTEVERMLARIVGEDIMLSASLAPELWPIDADPSHIDQVLMNLVINARDAMPHGGRLTIHTENVVVESAHASSLGVSPGRFVVLEVRDTGCGMDAATQARMFDPFFTTKEPGKGTGLGLSTVFGIIKQSDGAIVADSAVGRGTTFRVYFPCAEHAVVATTSRLPAIRPETGSGTILVVEDDPSLRAVLRRQLTSWGYRLMEAGDASTALALLRERTAPIDLLLTDLVMPGIDGRTLATRVLEDRPETKVLFMSGYAQHAAVKDNSLPIADHFIEKPFTGQALSSAIRRALGQP
ncbi:MAG: response regulator [Kofleriaceae bacterium]